MSRSYAAFEKTAETPVLLSFLEGELGLSPHVFAHHTFWQRKGAAAIWVATSDCSPPPKTSIEAIGILAFRRTPPRGFPTNAFLRRFGATASRRVVMLEETRAMRFLAGEALEIPDGKERGYCLVRTDTAVVGRGRWDHGILHSEVPRALRIPPSD